MARTEKIKQKIIITYLLIIAIIRYIQNNIFGGKWTTQMISIFSKYKFIEEQYDTSEIEFMCFYQKELLYVDTDIKGLSSEDIFRIRMKVRNALSVLILYQILFFNKIDLSKRSTICSW